MADYMQFTNTFNVADVKRLNNSRNGNPQFQFIFENGLEMRTPADVMWAYEIVPTAIIGTLIRVKYRTYRNGLQIVGIQ
jgi:hypothetical protein